jgi:hypothetical protein
VVEAITKRAVKKSKEKVNTMNLHMVVVPMFECHTIENMSNMVIKFLDTLYGQWCDKLIRMLSNGKHTRTSRHFGFVTCMV